MVLEKKVLEKKEENVFLDFKDCLVIGGAGPLGYEIADQLARQGKDVRILDLVPVSEERFEATIGDIRNIDDIRKAARGADIVFQTAAAVWDPKTPEEVYDEVNIKGNRQVIDVCLELGIKKLVYTSTLDVVVDGKKPIVDGDESLSYPQKMPKDPYCRTKIIADRMMLEANGPDLLTCVLRPVGMYGPRDKYHLANIIKAARKGPNLRLGNGKARFSHVYSENAAHAHILAAKHLRPGSPVAGSAYFITDGFEAENLFDFMEPFLIGLGLEPPRRSIPTRIAYLLSFLSEKIDPHTVFKRFAVIQTCIDHTFSSKKARQDLGYKPIVSREEAFQKTINWFSKNMKQLKNG